MARPQCSSSLRLYILAHVGTGASLATWVAFCLAAALIALHASFAHALESNQHGLTGSWTNINADGQGAMIEVYQDLSGPGSGYLQGGLFTYDAAAGGQQRWFTFGGVTFSGQSSVPITFYQNSGGNFNAPPITTASAIGSGLLSFTDCNNATLSYTMSNGGIQTGFMPLGRLTQNVSCVLTGNNEPSNLDFGLSGNWFNPLLPGQGHIVEINNVSKIAFDTWYTYALNGANLGLRGQRWLTAQGAYTLGARSISLNLYETTGGAFNARLPTPVTQQVGTATLGFATCQLAFFDFRITSGSLAGQSGTQTLQRISLTPRYCF